MERAVALWHYALVRKTVTVTGVRIFSYRESLMTFHKGDDLLWHSVRVSFLCLLRFCVASMPSGSCLPANLFVRYANSVFFHVLANMTTRRIAATSTESDDECDLGFSDRGNGVFKPVNECAD